MSSILKVAQQELHMHGLDTFPNKEHSVITPGCPHCKKPFYTVSQFVDHLAEDVLPQILLTALTTPTKYVYCDNCERAVEYEKFVLENDNDDRKGLEIACTKCHRVICTYRRVG
jgi:NAD-dependent SIR2 family protein deacetylase